MSSYTFSSSSNIPRSHRVVLAAFQSWPLIVSILSICIGKICFVSMMGYFPILWIDHYMSLLKCQIGVSKMVFCILLCVSTSNTMRRKLPPAQLSKECFSAVVVDTKHSAVTWSVKWDVYGRRVKLRIEFSKMVFAMMPDSKQCRNIIFSISVDCQHIIRINGFQLYFTLTVWMMIPVCARRD